jgi:hypothetical protein
VAVPLDTSPEARAVQLAVFRQMSGGERVAAALQMSEEAVEIAVAGIRTRHPEWEADRVAEERRILLLGRAVAQRTVRQRP